MSVRTSCARPPALELSASGPAATRRRAAALLGGFLCLCALSASLVAALGGDPGIAPREPTPGSVGDAAATLAANVRAALLPLLAIALLSGARRSGPANLARTRILCDTALLLAGALNAVLAGAVIGALGPGALRNLAPHAAAELGAFLALALAYLEARGCPLPARRVLGAAALALALLVTAAVLESYVSGAI